MSTSTDIGSRKAELGKLIGDWAAKKKLLKPGQVIEVDLRIVTSQVVTINIEGYQGLADINEMLVADLGINVRAQNCFNNANIETVGQLRNLKLDQLLNMRNMGRLAIRKTQEALAEIGIVVKWL